MSQHTLGRERRRRVGTLEGAGFIVRRPFPTPGLDLVDPFLLLDEMGPSNTRPARPRARPTTRTAASRP